MANKIQLKRGLKSKLPTLSQGEPAYTTDTREFFIGTGSGNVNIGGSHWYTGTAMSGASATANAYSYSACPVVKVGDIYLNTSNGNVYECTTAGSGTTAKWTYKGNIKGAPGSSITGQRGSKWFAGTAMTGTSTTTGAYTWNDSEQKYVGDMYINPDNGNIYRCTTAGTGTSAKWTYQGNKWTSILQSLCDYKSVYKPNMADAGIYSIIDFQNNGPADYQSDLFGALICITDVSGGDVCTTLDMQYYDSNDMVSYLSFYIYDSEGKQAFMKDGKSYIFKLQRKKINGSYIATIIAQW